MIKILVADDHALVRSGLRSMLEAEDDLDVVGEAADGAEAVDETIRLHPDVVVMDIRMPRLDGIEATRRIRAAPQAPHVLILTTFDLDEHVHEALLAGASGFLLKDAPPGQLIEGVRTIARGEALLAPAVTTRLIERFVRRAPAAAAVRERFAGLTDRELDVLRRIARGASNAEIAGELFLSQATVKTHVTRILGKLGLRDRVQAVVLAYEAGLVEPGGAPTE